MTKSTSAVRPISAMGSPAIATMSAIRQVRELRCPARVPFLHAQRPIRLCGWEIPARRRTASATASPGVDGCKVSVSVWVSRFTATPHGGGDELGE
jgi:hypothetical protein